MSSNHSWSSLMIPSLQEKGSKPILLVAIYNLTIFKKLLQGLKICESTKFVKDTMTKLLYLVFFINSPERHTPERFFWKILFEISKIKIFLPHFFPEQGQSRYQSAYFPCHHFICVRRGEKKSLINSLESKYWLPKGSQVASHTF